MAMDSLVKDLARVVGEVMELIIITSKIYT